MKTDDPDFQIKLEKWYRFCDKRAQTLGVYWDPNMKWIRENSSDVALIHKFFLGATAPASILGASKWRKPVDVYKEMLGPINTASSFAMRRGSACEDFVAKEAAAIIGAPIVGKRTFYRRIERPWSVAQIDRVLEVDGEEVFLELKTTRFNGKDKSGVPLCGNGCSFASAGVCDVEDDLISTDYFIQCQKQLAMGGKDYMFLACWSLSENAVKVYKIERNEEFIKSITEAEDCFLFNHVIAGIPPVNEVNPEFIFEETDENGKTIQLNITFIVTASLAELQARIKKLTAQADKKKKLIQTNFDTQSVTFCY